MEPRKWHVIALSMLLIGCAGAGAPPVISQFGAKEPIRRVSHTGTDYGIPIGTPILAVADGQVLWAHMGGNREKGGNSIRVSHGSGGSTTIYSHLKTILVQPGEFVKRGKVIALSGNTGYWPHPWSMPPHLHFQVDNPFPVNPYPSYWYGGEGKPLAFDPNNSYPTDINVFTHPAAFGSYYPTAKKIAQELGELQE